MALLRTLRSPQRRGVVGALAVVLLCGVAALDLGARLSHAAPASGAQPPAALIHQGDRIFIPQQSPLRQRIAVEAATARDLPRRVALPAMVEADPSRTANILPPLGGRIVALKVGLGQRVAKGQPLLVIESGDLAQAYADDDKARAALRLAQSTLKRVQGLQEAGAGAHKDLLQAQSDNAQAQAEYTRAETRLRDLGASLGGSRRQLTVTAPISGSVTALSAANGAYVNDPTASLMSIANLDPIWVTASVPESQIALISKGESVDVAFVAYPGQVFHGKVAFVSDVLDPDTRRAKVRISFANPDDRFKPNMFATATFLVPQRRAVFVPNAALIMNNDRTVVWVEVAPWTFQKRAVQPDWSEGDSARIDAGLAPGERIVVRGGVLLND